MTYSAQVHIKITPSTEMQTLKKMGRQSTAVCKKICAKFIYSPLVFIE
jgi:hypothetical protein